MECNCNNSPVDSFNLDPTLIILKHSIEENKVPTPHDLKTGEIALSLFPGQEALWVKNANGEVIDVRKPNSGDLWESVFIDYPTREDFDKALEAGEIVDSKIYFIVLEKQIWVKGEFYASDYDPKELDALFESRFVTIPSTVQELDFDTASSDQISEAWGGKEAFISLARKIESEKVSAAMSVKSGNIPVGARTDIKGGDHIEVILEWILNGKYTTVTFCLKYDIFGIEYWNDVEIGAKLEDDIEDLKDKVDSIDESLCWIEAY